jgi:hypothetical protein
VTSNDLQLPEDHPLLPLPPPGLQGDYAGSCFVCMKPTELGVATLGDVDFTMAFLVALGVPDDEADQLIRLDPRLVPAPDAPRVWRLCTSCAQAINVVPKLLVCDDGVPVLGQHPDERQ